MEKVVREVKKIDKLDAKKASEMVKVDIVVDKAIKDHQSDFHATTSSIVFVMAGKKLGDTKCGVVGAFSIGSLMSAYRSLKSLEIEILKQIVTRNPLIDLDDLKRVLDDEEDNK